MVYTQQSTFLVKLLICVGAVLRTRKFIVSIVIIEHLGVSVS